MYKLYLTLDNEKGNKIERLVDYKEVRDNFGGLDEIALSMIDTMEKVEKFDESHDCKLKEKGFCECTKS